MFRRDVVTLRGPVTRASIRTYFFSDRSRSLQTMLGLIWLLDAGLQFQSFMYGHGFVAMLSGMATGQPGWLHDSVLWGARTLQGDQPLFNTLFALIQVLLGVGLLHRATVRPALAASMVWAVFVWWFGEAFGMMFMAMASPLTGAPGAVILYALVAALAWPGPMPGGLLGPHRARLAWGTLWILMAWLWLEAPSSGADAISNAITAAPSGMSWLSTVQDWAASATRGIGLPIAVALAALSAAIGVGVVAGWRPRAFLALSVVLNLAFWVFGQGFGGIFQGAATDPNAGLLFVVLAWALDFRPPPAATAPVREQATDPAPLEVIV
jgi:hypothetical protein